MNHGIQEHDYNSQNGYAMIGLGTVLLLLCPIAGAAMKSAAVALVIIFLIVGAIVMFSGLYMVNPNQAAVLTLFGQYRGTDRNAGLRWANPFLNKQRISLRANNFISERLKVNDKRGNPIEIAAAIVWRVSDTARASFNVENYEQFVRVQSESAVRHLASSYAYDDMEEGHHAGEITLRSGGKQIMDALQRELASAMEEAGIVIDDARLTHLAYAPEIAGAMLRRQQAEAVLSARRKIVQGAVEMVESALKALEEKGVVDLDPERRAAMVSNLLVVLVGEREATPVINSGTLYG
ncbi:SPFH domain-containing protein [Burkholderiaceae bacterium DAT-1]|nr:SPFH domain-containing protein [Burkholderiaceae bacterium DAT-1]